MSTYGILRKTDVDKLSDDGVKELLEKYGTVALFYMVILDITFLILAKVNYSQVIGALPILQFAKSQYLTPILTS